MSAEGMRRRVISAALCAVLVLCAAAGARADTAPQGPLQALPYSPSLDLASMDRGADPCEDFYQYACGGWMKNNPIPPDQASWSVYGKLYHDNQRFLWGILDDLSAKDQGLTDSQRKLGDYFAACMNEDAVEALGTAPLEPLLAKVDAIQSLADLPAALGALQPALADDGLFFGFGPDQDLSNSDRVIAFARAGGLGLPDRDYYLRTDAKSKKLRAQYQAHVAGMFGLLGEAPARAHADAATVMRIETRLAKARLTRVQRRDPYKLFHIVDARGLQALTPKFDWVAFQKAEGLPPQSRFNVTEPGFYKALEQVWTSVPLKDLKTYLRWHVTTAMAPYLSSAFVNADFEFYRKTLRGVSQLQPRWQRCVELTDGQLGEALGKEFVERAFSPALKASTLHMTQQIEQAMRQDLGQITWMTPATRARAVEKLDAIVNKIGYPDLWRDYGALQVVRKDFAGNVERGNVFEANRQLAKIGRPLDRGEWQMTPPTVNAYYNPQMNDINFPAGVLQPPLYDPKMDDAPNYGNTGGTIGHELTHAFDDEGRQFDAKGNLKDWWTDQDAKAFQSRARCIVDQYSKYVVVDDIHINSKLTEGEDIADLGGLVLAWMAWQAQIAGTHPQARDGLSPEQRFFVGYAQWACENDRPENLRANAITNPHSPAKYRVNGLMVNLPQFQQAFSCKAGQPMVSAKPCRVW